MYNYLRFFLILICSATAGAQTTLLDQSMLTQASFDTFTPVSITGNQQWTFSPFYGAVCSGYSGMQSFANEDWLIGPSLNLLDTDDVMLTFSHTRGNQGVLNVGVAEGWYKVYATSEYSGDPATTDWIELTGFNQAVPAAWQYISSGPLAIPQAARSAQTRIAFRYVSGANQSATWEIKNVRITGQPAATNPNAGIFKITNWNTEWLGCTQFGPSDEGLQMQNVAAAMLSMNSDIYCLQEVTNNTLHPSLSELVSIMGDEQWDSRIMPNNTEDCDQRQGIIFKKSKVQLVNSVQLSSGNAAQGNSYYYNWSSGRYPSVYNVNLVSGDNLVPITLVNLHAKAEDGTAMAYTRRLGASEALKTILDGSAYNSKNVIIIGDFNDYLIGTTSNTCVCTASPYQNFMEDTSNYFGVTQDLIDVDTTFGTHPLIENTIVSNELSGNLIQGSALQEASVAQSIQNFDFTTSNHLPVSVRFQFAVLDRPEYKSNHSLTVYPNPATDVLTYDAARFANAQVYDLTGRLMHVAVNGNNLLVGALPVGVYVLRSGNLATRFIKQ